MYIDKHMTNMQILWSARHLAHRYIFPGHFAIPDSVQRCLFVNIIHDSL